MYLQIHCSVIYNHQDLEVAQVSIRLMDNTTLVHLHNEILLSHKKEGNFTLCKSMEGPGEHYVK